MIDVKKRNDTRAKPASKQKPRTTAEVTATERKVTLLYFDCNITYNKSYESSLFHSHTYNIYLYGYIINTNTTSPIFHITITITYNICLFLICDEILIPTRYYYCKLCYFLCFIHITHVFCFS